MNEKLTQQTVEIGRGQLVRLDRNKSSAASVCFNVGGRDVFIPGEILAAAITDQRIQANPVDFVRGRITLDFPVLDRSNPAQRTRYILALDEQTFNSVRNGVLSHESLASRTTTNILRIFKRTFFPTIDNTAFTTDTRPRAAAQLPHSDASEALAAPSSAGPLASKDRPQTKKFEAMNARVNHGLVVVGSETLWLHQTGRRAADTIDNPVIAAIPKKAKAERLPSRTRVIEGVGQMVSGGQDAAGLATYDGGRIDAMVVAADGCSFGGLSESAGAAQVAVETMLRAGKIIASDAKSARGDILLQLQAAVIAADKQIASKFPLMERRHGTEGATTVAAAAIATEMVDGKLRTYAYVAGCGDANILLYARRPGGGSLLVRLVDPADKASSMLSKSESDYFELTPEERLQKREELINTLIQNSGYTREQAEDVLMGSGITDYLGDRGNNSGLGGRIRTYKVDLTDEYFSRGFSDVKVLACSDYIGDKMDPRAQVAEQIDTAPKNQNVAERMLIQMANGDLDDGCLSMVNVKQDRSTL